MTTSQKLLVFAIGLAASLGVGWAIGVAAGPFESTPPPSHPHVESTR